jgi:transposase
MIQLAWRFLMFQKESALALWYRARTADSRIGTRKAMIPAFARTALARKLIIALWRFGCRTNVAASSGSDASLRPCGSSTANDNAGSVLSLGWTGSADRHK